MVGPGSVSCSYSDRVPETVAGVSAASAQGAAVWSLENSHPLILLYFSSSDNIFLTNSLHETPVYSEHPEQFLFSWVLIDTICKLSPDADRLRSRCVSCIKVLGQGATDFSSQSLLYSALATVVFMAQEWPLMIPTTFVFWSWHLVTDPDPTPQFHHLLIKHSAATFLVLVSSPLLFLASHAQTCSVQHFYSKKLNKKKTNN